MTNTHYNIILLIMDSPSPPGEHVIGVYNDKGGKLISLKGDQDILNIKDDDIIVIEIKD